MTPASSRATAAQTLGKVRIIGGSLRGSKLAVPDVDGLRPTPDRVRETVFNWLAPIVHGARCLDVFAGTGALGIEALSRGAAQVDFIERDARLAQALRDNLARLKQTHAQVRQVDALAALGDAATQAFDIVFLDPPFGADLWAEAARRIEAHAWLQANALVYVEAPLAATVILPPSWQPYREARAGNVRYALYRR
ncbi:MAG: 16S rRNA (guanine(966)-N(2))-methyltransferase RsmD [Proteobacteria bacterium]|nr:16S rRNA (guanine(966)-N(2))-methyltransferase RsmD [Pseudomonadota bacterium]